ncbi:uncharacterized protein LOC127746614 [Arachis duranensis]|uniref:Uncharacterized protein LOC127746614 n=1 Tax=Arachis duranensis TaxID=130453 RepID=A0A9C6TH24_ARADU|nr:uncharacterized protein LOC127746614 [Arachis duranensis]
MPRKPQYTVSTASETAAVPNSQTHATPHTDRTRDTGANTSSAQRRARAPLPPHSDEVLDDYSENEDYDPEADEVESFDDHVDDLFAAHEVERQENDVTSCMELTIKEALALLLGKKIVLNHNGELQQVGQAAGLLSRFLGTLGSDFQQLPICEKSWKAMSKTSKEHAFDQVKRVFHYEDNGRGRIKQGIVQRIGRSWKNARNHLFHKVYDEELTFEQNIKRKPPGIEANHWKKFIQYRLDEDTQEKCRKMPLIIQSNCTHIPKGRPIGRGEGWTMSHKKRMKAIEHIESQDPSSKEFSQNDSLAQVFGKEHLGRVCGLGFGPCLSQCFRNILQQSDYGVQIKEYQMKIVKLKAEAAELKVVAAE